MANAQNNASWANVNQGYNNAPIFYPNQQYPNNQLNNNPYNNQYQNQQNQGNYAPPRFYAQNWSSINL